MDKEFSQMTEKIIAYENGNMTDGEVVAFFQQLVDTGLAWSLQGLYGRMAAHLISEGLVVER
jgi:hypothetical protein